MNTAPNLLLVTVTPVESRAVLDAFERHTGQPAKIQPRGDKTYHDLGVVNGTRVWLVLSEMGAGGLGGSQQSVGKAIAEIRPSAVMMVGIAFGMSEEHQAIGDILVSENLRLYELQRAGSQIILRGDRPHGSPWLLDVFKNARLHWTGATVRFGCVLTGEKLVDNLDFREQLRAFEPEAVGGEMEGAGLYAACQDAKVDWLLIKAICDWADGSKEFDRQPRQELAARNAAEFVLHTLQTVGVSKQKRGDDPADDDLLQAFTGSLATVAEDCSKLVTRGISVSGDTHQKPLRLAHVYVGLDTKSPRPVRSKAAESAMESRETLSALEALFDPKVTRVVLVGEPGSGKSTFLQYVTLCLADRLCIAGGKLSHMTGLPVPELLRGVKALPLRILLREFAAELDACRPGTSEDVEGFLRARLQKDSHNDAAANLPEILTRGLAFVLFDGLDEVPRALVPAVRQAIAAFAGGGYRKCRIAVTCRTESYRKKNAAGEDEFRLGSFPAPQEIAPLSPGHRKHFVRAWYHEIEEVQPQFRGEGTACAASLLNALGTDRLREMAGNPFFLTAMAALHRPDKPLPDTSAELMHLLVNGVLEEARKPGPAAGSRTGELELAALLRPIKDGLKVLRLRLEAIAYAAREKRQDQASRLVDEDLLRARLFLDKKVNEEWVDSLIECLLHRAGLLQSPNGKDFEFAYRFEEFLAGCHLANRDAWVKLQPSFVKRTRELLTKQGDYARQVVIWAAGVNAHVQIDRSTVRELVSELTPKNAVAGTGSLTDLELAADIARDAGMDHWQDEDVPDTGDTVSRLRARLEEVRDHPDRFEIEARSRAASAIGRLGDLRAGVGLRADGLPDIDFDIEIPPGPFPMGYPPKKCDIIKQPYRIGRYPVTVAQYQAFVAAGGYGDDGSDEAAQRLPRWWTPEGLQWKRDNDITGPDENQPVFQTPNHPRVGVSWYEATAFCRWLSAELKRPIVLPSETQWERAARHTDGRDYPWGKQEDDIAQRCNMDGTGLNHTSAVGLFPSGTADCGAMDMSGNVCEWSEDLYQSDQPDRVLRGGSWINNDPRILRCSNRNNDDPGNRNNKAAPSDALRPLGQRLFSAPMNFQYRLRWMLPAALVAYGAYGAYGAAQAADAPEFAKDIRPILEKNCFECHGEKKQKGGLRMDRRADFLKGGDSAKAPFEPGKSAESDMVKRILSNDDDEKMPPKGARLPPEQVAKIKAWIDAGALIADDGSGSAAKHWAYVKPEAGTLPEIGDRQLPIANGIDRWILARLDKEGLKPSVEADPAVLVRRVSLDLTGLPPSLVEVDASLADKSPEAFAKTVDRLLASPAYGERWARPWLDLARYADTQGYEKDNRRTMWPYRDWVIGALNRDLPFDQFTIEQIAGDLLPNATQDQKVATGFHRNTMTNTEGGTDDEEFRYEALVDRLNTTFGVWMGSTMACAQCHNHKYDPFLTREYYQAMAFLNNTADSDKDDEYPVMRVYGPGQEEKLAALRKVQQEAEKRVQDASSGEAFQKTLEDWEKKAAPTKWTTLEPVKMSADGEVKLLPAGNALLATGPNPAKAIYTVTTKTGLKGITGFRLEALADDALPGKGPGRSSAGNIILTEFKVTADGKPVPLGSASADFSQDVWPVAHAIDGNPETGWAWAPQFGQPHTATFATREKLDAETLIFTLEHTNSQWAQHALGKFRLAVTTSPLDIAPIPPEILALLKTPAPERYEKQQEKIVAYFKTVWPGMKSLADGAAAAKKEAEEFYKEIPVTSVMAELDKPRVTKRHIRGGYLATAEEVQPGTPAVLNPFPKDAPANRLGFARWIVDRENPLTARVIVNRIWEQYFGKGIVETVEEFGKQGEPPSHPELLDWLAVQFMDGCGSGKPWSMKALHRLIVTSATYRQSSAVTPELHERDPFNRLLARGPRVRLEAEMIRDQALAVSGLLSKKIGGPSVMPPQPDGLWQMVYSGDEWKTSPGEDKYRRGLYTFWRRSMPHPMMTTFDAPSREFCVLRRNRSDTPLQALNTLNDPVFIEAAQALARKITAAPGDAKSRATFAFRTALARMPKPDEVARLVRLFDSELARYINDPAAAEKMAASELGKPAGDANMAELAAWTVVANVLLNLDEAITKG